MEDPAVPGLVEEVAAQEDQHCKDGIPVPGRARLLDLLCEDIGHHEEQGHDVPLEHGKVPESDQCLSGSLRISEEHSYRLLERNLSCNTFTPCLRYPLSRDSGQRFLQWVQSKRLSLFIHMQNMQTR